MRKLFSFGIAAALMLSALTGCGTQPGATEAPSAEPEAFAGDIYVCTRENGSGTRGAFVELFGVEEKNEAGEKVDYTTTEAEITNSTSVMIRTVAGNEKAIGYISLGTLNSDIKAVKIEGVDATAENVKNGSYTATRPFNIVVKDSISEASQDFINFIMSDEGQAIVEEEGCVSGGSEGAFTPAAVSGEVKVYGSSSVYPVMGKLAEAYEAVNANVSVDVQMSDSTTGINNATEGVCDIGMASRELKDEEVAAGVSSIAIAIDGIAVIVNNANPTDDLTKDEVKQIFRGELTDWTILN